MLGLLLGMLLLINPNGAAFLSTTTTTTRRRLDHPHAQQQQYLCLAARPHRAAAISRDHRHHNNNNDEQLMQRRQVVAVQQELELLHRLQQKQQQQHVVDDESDEASSNGVARRTEIAEEALDILMTTTNDKLNDATTRRKITTKAPLSNNNNDDLWNRNGETLEDSVLQVPLDSNHSSHHSTQTTLLRMIVISDTHGFEQQLFPNNTLLPDADVLVHCGDFCSSGARTTKLQARQLLDEWLSQQRHIPTKLIVRGNHDPHHHARGNLFPLSQATYITKPTTLQISSSSPNNNKRLTVCIRPYSRRKDVVLLPETCDVLISHEPPFGLLDLTYTNQNAGSKVLRKSVEASSSTTKPPKLWLCGHIHEGRGSVLHSFQHHSATSKQHVPTLVINAANANSGRANRVVTGPVVVEVVDSFQDEEMKRAWNETVSRMQQQQAALAKPTTQRDSSLEAMRRLAADNNGSDDDRRLMLAVDLGHPITNTALLDNQGNLLKVQKWRITDKATLDEALHEMLSASGGVVTHVVVDSGDAKLFRIWKRAIASHGKAILLTGVLSDDWKVHFALKAKEQQTARTRTNNNIRGKTVAIARKYAGERGDTKLIKDAAQAILVGYYALSILGWTDEEPIQATHNLTSQS